MAEGPRPRLDAVGHALGPALRAAAESPLPDAGLRFLDADEAPTFLHWREVRARALAAAGALARAGVGPGDRVAIVLPTGPAFFDAFLGAALRGAVPVPLYPPVRLGRMDEYVDRTTAMLRAVGAVAVVTDGRVRRVLGRVVEAARPRLGALLAESLVGAPFDGPDPGADALAMVQFSSGTTVDPKPVALTHRQILANADRILDHVLTVTPRGGDPEPGGVSWLPLYHDMGLVGCVLPALLGPGPLTLLAPERFLARPALWLRALSRWRGTVSPAPDFAYALCTERIRDDELDGVDLSAWRLALDGAEPIRPDTLRAFAERFARWGFRADALSPVYGLSEAALAVTFTPPGRGPRFVRVAPETLAGGRVEEAPDGHALPLLGPPLPDFGVEIRGADGARLADRVPGRVFVSGPSLMAGYLGRDVQPIVDGWLDTGDLGFLADGELVITGRAKDVIVHRGRNHAPTDLERAVDGVPGVRTGCSAAVADVGPDGERVLVFVEVREPAAGQAEACATAVRAATGVGPDLVVVLAPGTLPRTSSGKIRRSETLARWRAGTLTPPAAVTPLHLAGVLAQSWLAHLRVRWGRG